jgi:hypothetical protein
MYECEVGNIDGKEKGNGDRLGSVMGFMMGFGIGMLNLLEHVIADTMVDRSDH